MATRITYRGFSFKLTEELYPFAESEGELIGQFKQTFDHYGEEIINSLVREPLATTEDAKVIQASIDWHRYFAQKRTYRGERVLDEYVKILVALGILSLEREGNWLVNSCGININPVLRDVYTLSFVNKDDAIAFAKASYWHIDYIAKLTNITPGSDLKA